MILVRRLFRFSGRSADVSRDVESELRFHLDMRAQELMEAGMGPQAARLAALQSFGEQSYGSNRRAQFMRDAGNEITFQFV